MIAKCIKSWSALLIVSIQDTIFLLPDCLKLYSLMIPRVSKVGNRDTLKLWEVEI